MKNILENVKPFDWTALVSILVVGLALDLVLGHSIFPRAGALCVVIGAFIAGKAEELPKKPGLSHAHVGEPSVEQLNTQMKHELAKREYELAKDEQLLTRLGRVPIWVILGTLAWGFGDLLTCAIKVFVTT